MASEDRHSDFQRIILSNSGSVGPSPRDIRDTKIYPLIFTLETNTLSVNPCYFQEAGRSVAVSVTSGSAGASALAVDNSIDKGSSAVVCNRASEDNATAGWMSEDQVPALFTDMQKTVDGLKGETAGSTLSVGTMCDKGDTLEFEMGWLGDSRFRLILELDNGEIFILKINSVHNIYRQSEFERIKNLKLPAYIIISNASERPGIANTLICRGLEITGGVGDAQFAPAVRSEMEHAVLLVNKNNIKAAYFSAASDGLDSYFDRAYIPNNVKRVIEICAEKVTNLARSIVVMANSTSHWGREDDDNSVSVQVYRKGASFTGAAKVVVVADGHSADKPAGRLVANALVDAAKKRITEEAPHYECKRTREEHPQDPEGPPLFRARKRQEAKDQADKQARDIYVASSASDKFTAWRRESSGSLKKALTSYQKQVEAYRPYSTTSQTHMKEQLYKQALVYCKKATKAGGLTTVDYSCFDQRDRPSLKCYYISASCLLLGSAAIVLGAANPIIDNHSIQTPFIAWGAVTTIICTLNACCFRDLRSQYGPEVSDLEAIKAAVSPTQPQRSCSIFGCCAARASNSAGEDSKSASSARAPLLPHHRKS
jgi:hypothetical protein